MRSDWDPDHNKRADIQKRYPDITEEEWRFILRLLGASLAQQQEGGSHIPTTKLRTASIKYTTDLIRKVEQRIREGEKT